MTKFKKSEAPNAREWIDRLPKDRLAKAESGAAAIIHRVHLAELRKAMDTTQARLAEKSGMKQAEISRVEHHPETVQIRTMERYVRSLGGELKIVAIFPDGTRAEIPIHAGRPVKSRITAEQEPTGNDNYGEARLGA
ncbi:helix-turn-helix domain-containing protein [Mesorhizobium sp. WSM2561]|uniref:helix-turn-helix domain-containing protein n=1 Tax=Mesorhizobium sp. WSM2561 TaxID=1040985 RepID=UPI0004AE2F5D|nr:helix-turn-helix domain-containing protein [Mesorhizobium sp. WSM2561]